MPRSFQALMRRAAELTRLGHLGEATQALQQALHIGTPAPGPAALDGGRQPPGAARRKPPESAPATPAEGRFIEGHHVQGAMARDYKLYIPSHPKPGASALVVMLHGCLQDADDFAAGTGMNALAEAGGFFVLYPQQSAKANPQRCWNWFKHNHQQRGRGEPDLIAGLTRAVVTEHGIAPDRVFIAGLSAGGAMADIVAATHPELYAAVGVHSGLPRGAATDLSGAMAAMREGGGADVPPLAAQVPTIVFHGDADTTVHPRNGEQVTAAAVSGSATTTTQVESGVSAEGRRFTRATHHDAAGHARVEHWVVHGAGHAWSGGRQAGSYTDASGPDASREMLRFFFAQPRRRAT